MYRFLIKYCAVNGRVCWRISHILMDSVTQNRILFFVFSVGRHHFHSMNTGRRMNISIDEAEELHGERLSVLLKWKFNFPFQLSLQDFDLTYRLVDFSFVSVFPDLPVRSLS
jgi:hypothetical protein